MTEPSTPLMRQYAAIKKAHPQTLLFFRLGDFYELFFDDAVVASHELQITLTSRNKEKDVAVPFDAVHFKKKDNRWYPVVNTTKETLRNAPGYKYDRNAQSWVPEHASGTTGPAILPASCASSFGVSLPDYPGRPRNGRR